MPNWKFALLVSVKMATGIMYTQIHAENILFPHFYVLCTHKGDNSYAKNQYDGSVGCSMTLKAFQLWVLLFWENGTHTVCSLVQHLTSA